MVPRIAPFAVTVGEYDEARGSIAPSLLRPDTTVLISGATGDLLQSQRYAPTPALFQFVSTYWTLTSAQAAKLDGVSVRLIPDGSIDITFDLFRGTSVVTGASTEPASHAIGHWSCADLLAVRFRPGGAHRLLRADAHALGAGWEPLDSLLGVWARNLTGQLLDAPSIADRVRILDGALVDRLLGARIDPLVAYAINAIERARGSISIAELARRIGITERHLVRLFDRWVGFGPKRFARIARLQGLLSSVANDPAAPWAKLAYTHGFADQSHLAREFTLLAGMTPETYRPAIAEPARPMSDLFKKRRG